MTNLLLFSLFLVEFPLCIIKEKEGNAHKHMP
jgi:hypothetical protein